MQDNEHAPEWWAGFTACGLAFQRVQPAGRPAGGRIPRPTSLRENRRDLHETAGSPDTTRVPGSSRVFDAGPTRPAAYKDGLVSSEREIDSGRNQKEHRCR